MTSKALIVAAALSWGYLFLIAGHDMADLTDKQTATEATQ